MDRRQDVYRKMLVPLDGSKLAEETFPYAQELAARLNLDLHFLHVSNPIETHLLSMSQMYVDGIAESVRKQIQKIQTTFVKRETVRSIKVRGKVVTGSPADEILKYAEKNKIDIIMMATQGASGIRRWALGSVTYKVLHTSNLPIWIVRSGISPKTTYDKWPQRTILVPLDGSELSESAIPHAEELAKQQGSGLVEVVLLRVCESPSITADYPFPDWKEHVKRQTDWLKQESHRYLTSLEKRLKDTGIKVQSQVMMGKASDEIIKYTSKKPYTVIVMTTRGHSGLSKWAFGHVTESILYEGNTPLLVIKESKVDLE